LGPLRDPAADEVHVGGRERRLLGRHRGLAIDGRDLVDEEGFIGLAGDNRGRLRLAAGEQAIELSHHVSAAGLGGLMATLALRLEDGAYLLVVADLVGALGSVITCLSLCERRGERDAEGREQAEA